MTINQQQLLLEITWQFIRAAGPGGQHVNKTSSAAQLHFNVAQSSVITTTEKQRLYSIAGNRINKQHELVITAQSYRSQLANKQEALRRLEKFLARAQHVPKKRTKTHISKNIKAKNKKLKQQHSHKKQQRKIKCDY